jgi:DNA-binding response OmpR family regulator
MEKQKPNAGGESGKPGLSFAQSRLLVIDDDRKLCRLLKDYLEPMGYAVESAYSGPEGLEKASQEQYQAIILDVMLPGMNGFEVLKRLRQKSDVPVLMLTARGEEADRIVGLEIGADDYLPKTFSTRELLARLRAVTRRAAQTAASDKADILAEVVVGPLRINPETRIAVLGDQPLVLTPVEFELLLSLARARGRVRTREQLLDEVAERNYDVFDRSIDVHISALRRKLGDDSKAPRFIKTIRAVGYMLVDPNAPTP